MSLKCTRNLCISILYFNMLQNILPAFNFQVLDIGLVSDLTFNFANFFLVVEGSLLMSNNFRILTTGVKITKNLKDQKVNYLNFHSTPLCPSPNKINTVFGVT